MMLFSSGKVAWIAWAFSEYLDFDPKGATLGITLAIPI
jgi:hypothetical protein